MFWACEDGEEDEFRVGVAMSIGDAEDVCIFEEFSFRLVVLSGDEGPHEKVKLGGEDVVSSWSSSINVAESEGGGDAALRALLNQ